MFFPQKKKRGRQTSTLVRGARKGILWREDDKNHPEAQPTWGVGRQECSCSPSAWGAQWTQASRLPIIPHQCQPVASRTSQSPHCSGSVSPSPSPSQPLRTTPAATTSQALGMLISTLANSTCHLGWAPCPDVWPNITPEASVRCF